MGKEKEPKLDQYSKKGSGRFYREKVPKSTGSGGRERSQVKE